METAKLHGHASGDADDDDDVVQGCSQMRNTVAECNLTGSG